MPSDGKTHIFRGKTYVEAVAKAKTKLGKDISIVNRRDVRESNLFSKLTSGKLGGDTLAVELEVAVTQPEPRKAAAIPVAPNPLLKTYAKALEGVERHSPAVRQALAAAAAPYASVGEASTGIAGRLDDFQRALERTNRENADMREELRTLLSIQARGGLPAVTPELLDFHRRLVNADVEEGLARNIVEELQRDHPGIAGGERILSELRKAVARRIPCAGPALLVEGRPTVVALVGPSGVGKSTSVVKLAIHFAMHGGKSVGVVNEDLRRPGADGQINNLGRLFGIAVSTVSEAKEMADVVKSMSGRDLILVDTGGRSPRDAGGIEELGALLRAAGADETHLLLSSVGSEKMLRETVVRYQPTGFDRVIMTKLDECVTYGPILNVASGLASGLSYVTSGPDYHQPIQPADGGKLADLVLGLEEIRIERDDARADSA